MPSHTRTFHWILWPLLFCLAFLVLGLGIWVPTGLTGKDEFFLGLRTPIEMMERQQWWIPFLDGAPRIRKPPLLYWLTRASYETFGISLASARAVTTAFGALLVVATAGIGRRLLGEAEGASRDALRVALLASVILLGCLGMASESRRLMLDIPVAALSACAFWAFLIWQERQKTRWLILATLCFGAGFLVKGPIVALVCGGGMLALLLNWKIRIRTLITHWRPLLLSLITLAVIALPWFILVRQQHPEAAAAVYNEEMEARQLLSFSLDMLPGLLQIALPWSFVALALIWQARGNILRERGPERLLLVWLLATCLPFLLIRTFDRYLLGSLIPLALLMAWQLRDKAHLPLWPARLGMGIAVLFGGALSLFAWRFQLGGWYLWVPAALYFVWAWGKKTHRIYWLSAPVVYWITLLWGLFPALGVNAVPPEVQVLGKTRMIAMYDGPQPALLPILSGRTLQHWPRVLPEAPEAAQTLMQQQGLVFIEENDLPRLTKQLAAIGLAPRIEGSYQVLASHGSGLRFIRSGASRNDWLTAWKTRDLTPLMTRIYWLSLTPLPPASALPDDIGTLPQPPHQSGAQINTQTDPKPLAKTRPKAGAQATPSEAR